MSEPSPEVLRRLDEMNRQLGELVNQLRADRIEAAATYVRKDVYAAESSALKGRVGDLELTEASRAKNASETRRQLFFVVIGAALPSLASLIVVLFRLSGSN